MSDIHLDPPVIPMPDFAPGEWLNTERPLTKDALRGQVALAVFWDYTSLACIRALPYIAAWHERYEPLGLAVTGIHAAAFSFARTRKQVAAALGEFGIRYPILLDTEFETWRRFANRTWPTCYLIDATGAIRHRQQGEGFYREFEMAIQAALQERDPLAHLPEPLPHLRPEDAPGAACHRPTPELHAGWERGALGNPTGYAAGSPLVYDMPPGKARGEGMFYASGIWRGERDCMVFAGEDGGRIILPYRGVAAHAVLSPTSDPVELLLDLPPLSNRRTPNRDTAPIIEVRQDGRHLRPENAGEDIEYDDGGLSYVEVSRPRLYELTNNPRFEAHDLELVFHATGLAAYSFSFSTSVIAHD